MSYVVQPMQRRKNSWIGHILFRNCLLKHCMEGKTEGRLEVTGRRGGRLKQLLDDLKGKRRYCKLIKKHQIAFCEELALEEAMDLS